MAALSASFVLNLCSEIWFLQGPLMLKSVACVGLGHTLLSQVSKFYSTVSGFQVGCGEDFETCWLSQLVCPLESGYDTRKRFYSSAMFPMESWSPLLSQEIVIAVH